MKSLAMFIYLFVCFWWLWGCTYSWKSQEMVQTWSSNFQGGSVWYHTFAWSCLVHIPKGPPPFPWLHTLSGPLLHTWLPFLLLRRARLCSIHWLLYWPSVQPVSVNGHFSVQEQRKRCPISVLCKSFHSCSCVLALILPSSFRTPFPCSLPSLHSLVSSMAPTPQEPSILLFSEATFSLFYSKLLEKIERVKPRDGSKTQRKFHWWLQPHQNQNLHLWGFWSTWTGMLHPENLPCG